MEEEQTLATEVRAFFQSLAKKPDRLLQEAFANVSNTAVDSDKFFAALSAAKANCDQLTADIHASGLKVGSKQLYANAVNTFANYLRIGHLQSTANSAVRGEAQAFQLLTLIDDYLTPLDARNMSGDFLKSLKKQAQAMMGDLEEANLDPRLKAFLSAQISQFLWSIQNHHIVGVEGISRAWGAMAAEISRSQGMKGAQKAEYKAFTKKVLPIIGTIHLAIMSVSATVQEADKMITSGANMLGIGSADEEKDGGAKSGRGNAVDSIDEDVIIQQGD